MPRLSLAKLERHLYAAADRLRQEGLDAAIYKDYIFGLLFLKRCSDVFEAEREKIVGKKVEQGAIREQVEETYGEDPDYYDGFFVPPRSRWAFLNQKLNDAGEPFGSVLDKALGGLSETNDSLQHVLDHISFMRTQGNKRVISDEACKDLVRHFSRQRLRNEDFQFSDLLGAAYEFLINMFAESAGKKGGDFYTPRDVIRLMARLLKPQPKMSIYDPTCGSGGMLIISREHVEQSGGDPSDLRLCGRVNDASAWSICRLNMLLHGVRGADIRLQDTCCTRCTSMARSSSASTASSPIRRSARTTRAPTWSSRSVSAGVGALPPARRVTSCSPSTCCMSASRAAWSPP